RVFVPEHGCFLPEVRELLVRDPLDEDVRIDEVDVAQLHSGCPSVTRTDSSSGISVAVMSEPHLLVERDGHVVTVTMNRPERKNAFSTEMLVRAYDAWKMIDEDPDVRVAILTGAGGDFCSGADLKEMAGGYGGDTNEWRERMQGDSDLHWKALLRHFRPMKPIIAAVEGYAVAGGTEILQATEIRIAGESATFGVTEVRRGLFPLGGSTIRLRRQIS